MRLIADLDLDEVSLVRDPANPEARVALFKTGGNMDLEAKVAELTKQLEEMTAEKAAAEDKLSAVEGEKEAVAKSFADLSAAVEALGFEMKDGTLEKAAAVEYIEIEGERIVKSSVPAPILKALEAKDAELRKAAEEKARVELRKRAGELFPNLKGTLDQRAALLKSLECMPEMEQEGIMESLKAADQAMALAFKEEGKGPSGESMDDPEAALNKMVDEYAKTNSTNFYKAYAAIVKTAEGKSLLKKIKQE